MKVLEREFLNQLERLWKIYKKFGIWDIIEVRCDWGYEPDYYEIYECIWFDKFNKILEWYNKFYDSDTKTITVPPWNRTYNKIDYICTVSEMFRYSDWDRCEIIWNISNGNWYEKRNSEWRCKWSDWAWVHFKVNMDIRNPQ